LVRETHSTLLGFRPVGGVETHPYQRRKLNAGIDT